MNKIQRIAVLIICLWSSFPALYSQQIISWEMPFLEQLPTNEIIEIYQDERGFMWLGTTDGLARYDGYSTQIFRSDFSHPDLLFSNYILSISENENYICIGTSNGLNLLNKNTCQIIPFPDERMCGPEIRCILRDEDNSLWITTYGKLYRCDSSLSLSEPYNLGKTFNSVYKDRNGDVWVLTWAGGLYKYLKETDAFKEYPPVGVYNNPFCMLQDREGHYWLATWGDGLYLFNPEAEGEEMYHRLEMMNSKLKTPENTFFSLVQDDVYGYVWALGYNEMYALELSADEEVRQVDISAVIDKNKMFSRLHKDSDGNIWLGSYDVGHSLFFEETDIRNYELPSIKDDIGFDSNILCLYKDSDEYFWLNQERYGLCLLNAKTGTLTYGINNDKLHPVDMKNIIGSSEKGCVWASVKYIPLVLKMKKSGDNALVQEEIALDKIIPNAGLIDYMLEDKVGNLWIRTSTHLFIKPVQGATILIDTGVSYMANFTLDKDGFVWVAGYDGNIHRLRYDDGIKTDRILKLTGLDAKDRIACVYADADNNLWCATSQGRLLVFDKGMEPFEDKTQACGMNGESILNILGNQDCLWLVTNQSITQHNLHTENNVKYFTADEDISVSAFRSRAACLEGNSVYIGGHGGFVSIGPDKGKKKHQQIYPVQITDIKVNSRSLFFGADSCGYKNSVRQCTFEPGDENIEILFSSLKYAGNKKIKYAYQLKGVDKDWVYIDEGKRSAFYNKLGKGEYTFQVKSTDEKGNWGETVTSLTIVKLPAYYETWYAYLIYIVVSAGILYLMLRSYMNRMKLKNSLKLNEELSQTKLRYFTNISHELLTPLTIISCATDELEMKNEGTGKQVQTLRSNVNRLKKLLLQVLDFRKIENGKMALRVSKGNISEFITHIGLTNFQSLAQSKNIDFTLEVDDKNLWGYIDFDKIDQVLFNLLSNAIKYTPEQKRITLWAGTEEEEGHLCLCIKVMDEGVGIPAKELENIFTRFYNNRQHAGESNGIGLSLTKELITLHHGTIRVESKVNKGSCFIVTVPIDKEAYSAGELMYEEQPVIVEEESQPEADDEKLCMLIVDDNPELLELMKNIFVGKYRVLTAQNGKEALEMLKDNAVNIIICDMMMPEMDGLTCCRILKEDINTSHIPVIMLTAKNTAEDRVAAYDAGANAFIAKPFDLKVLHARITNLIYSSELRQKEFRMSKEINLSKLEVQSNDEIFLESAVKCIEHHLDNSEFDVNAFADELSVSKSTLNRKIKAMTGLTALDFIKNIRLKYACGLLKKKGMNISEVAYLVGFNNPKYFTKCFKEEFGMTPTEYQGKNECLE